MTYEILPYFVFCNNFWTIIRTNNACLNGTAYKAWLLEKISHRVRINEQAKTDALLALYKTFGSQMWWVGGFQWKWHPNLEQALNKDEATRDYTPEGKKTEKAMQALFRPIN